jgi:predicted nucleic acid-binding protein
MLVLDSGAISRLAQRSTRALALLRALRAAHLWPPVVPSVVLIESLQGHSGRDANVNRFLKTCIIDDKISVELARRAAHLRRMAGRGSAVDALLVAFAEPNGVVLTGDAEDLQGLAAHADAVGVERI